MKMADRTSLYLRNTKFTEHTSFKENQCKSHMKYEMLKRFSWNRTFY
uniref:Uncharacterized protein n=1 Tax=Arundo donax TaxID=35708 RepID=A0A0A9FPA5_ARUDO